MGNSVYLEIAGFSFGKFEVLRDKQGKLYLKSQKFGTVYNRNLDFQRDLESCIGSSVEDHGTPSPDPIEEPTPEPKIEPIEEPKTQTQTQPMKASLWDKVGDILSIGDNHA